MSYQMLLETTKKYYDATKELPWLQKKIQLLTSDFQERFFFLAFSACPRYVGKETLSLTIQDLTKLEQVYPNFSATTWNKDEIARILLMMALPTNYNQELLNKLFETADYKESISLFKGIFFLPNAASFVPQIRMGLRTNMVGIFDAIALHNPYPTKYLTEDAWNHMVLKAIFMDRPIYKIYQIEKRKNEKLALIMQDYAHERWAAHRKVTPELWRFISGFVDKRFIKDIQKTIHGDDELESLAATKALLESNYTAGKEWLQKNNITTTNLPSWAEIGKQLEIKNNI